MTITVPEELQKEWHEAITHFAMVMEINLRGFVFRQFNCDTSDFDWVFGSAKWPRLLCADTGLPWQDDPMNGNRGDIPLADFLLYLRDWYHPRRKRDIA